MYRFFVENHWQEVTIGKLVKIIIETEQKNIVLQILKKRVFVNVFLAPAVLKVDKANHLINPYPMENTILVFLTLICWIVIFLLDSNIWRLSN